MVATLNTGRIVPFANAADIALDEVGKMISGSTVKAMLLTSLSTFTLARHGVVHQAHQQANQHHHEAVPVGRRQLIPPMPHPPAQTFSATHSKSVLAYITPSPGASPVPVTKQSQLVGSYVAEFTLCVLPPVAFYPVTRQPSSARPIGTAPYQNYSISIPSGTGSCSTHYKPTMTMVCATTLTALAKKYTVTNCAQDLTFSTEYGYVLVTPKSTTSSVAASDLVSILPVGTGAPVLAGSGVVKRAASVSSSAVITPGPYVEKLTTYYLAPWQQLTAGTAPEDVDLKVCRTFAQNDSTECIREYQVWSTSLVTSTATSVKTVNISTTIHGRSQLIVEHFTANITEVLTTFSLSTTIDLEYQTEWTSTYKSALAKSTSTGPTVYETKTVMHPSSTPS